MVALNNNWIEVARVHKNVNGGMYDVVLWAREPDQWIDIENNKSWIEVSLDTEWVQGNTYGGNYLISCGLQLAAVLRIILKRLKTF